MENVAASQRGFRELGLNGLGSAMIVTVERQVVVMMVTVSVLSYLEIMFREEFRPAHGAIRPVLR